MELEFLLRLVIAAVLGAAIGFERELHAKEAGIRTHLLVSLGSCLFMILSIYAFEGFYTKEHTSFDPSRIAAQVVTGIGFLGAGTIIFHKNIIRGLTTAAGLWVTSAIGLACGAGLYILAIISTALVLLSLGIMNVFLKRLGSRIILLNFQTGSQTQIQAVIDKLKENNVEIKDYSLKEVSTHEGIVLDVALEIKTKRYKYNNLVSDIFREFSGVKIISIE